MIHKLLQQMFTIAMALVLAVFIWWYAYVQTSLSMTMTLPVAVDASTRDIQTTVNPQRVDVSVSGPRRLINQITGDEGALSLVVPMGEAEEGQPSWRDKVKLDADLLVGLPPGLTVNFQPSEVTVTYFRNRTGMLPVKVRIEGTPAPGYRVDEANIWVSPAEVEVTGPESLFANPDKRPEIATLPVNIDPNVASSTTVIQREVRLNNTVADLPVRFTGDRDRMTVLVRIPIVHEMVTSTFKGVKVRPALPWPFPNALVLNRDTVDLTVTGTREDLDKLRPETIRALVMVNETLVTNTPTLGRVVVVFPEGLNVRLVESAPSEIPYEILSKEGTD